MYTSENILRVDGVEAMGIEVKRNPPSQDLLREYAKVPMTFTVTSRIRADSPGFGEGGPIPIEERIEPPYDKDYDREADGPADQWLRRWDISHWVVISATKGSRHLGGAIVGYGPPVELLEESRDDLAVLWDIRVHPEFRGTGIGSQLFRSAVEWARQKGCKELKVETQDINVPACRFYAVQGCELQAVSSDAYPELPHETQLLWYLHL